MSETKDIGALTTLFSRTAGYKISKYAELDLVQVIWPLKAEIVALRKTSIEQAAQILELQSKLKNVNNVKIYYYYT
jgi:hypothetical protein